MSAESIGMKIPQGDGLSVGLSTAGTLFSVIGGMGTARAARRQGAAMNAAAQFEAAQLEQNAGQAIAAAQRVKMSREQHARLIASRALAVGAKNGGLDDPGVQNVIADIEGEGAYRAMIALYDGEERARQLRMGAGARRYEGALAEQAGIDIATGRTIKAFGTGATDIATMYSKYGHGGPSKQKSGDGWLDAGTPDFLSIG